MIAHRDAAIESAVRAHAPIAFERLFAHLPDEHWPTEDARKEALSNVLTRLRLKKKIRLDAKAGGWCWELHG